MSDIEYKFFCDKCKYGTNYKYSMEKHEESEIHKSGVNGRTKKKQILKCDKCDFETSSKSNYTTHILNNHVTKEERKKSFKYYCEICDIGMLAETVYNTHIQTTRHKRFVARLENKNEQNNSEKNK